jgi:hypothetical protein
MTAISPIISSAVEAIEPRLAVRPGLSLSLQLEQVESRQTKQVGLELYEAVEGFIAGGEPLSRQMSQVRLSVSTKSGERQFQTIREFKEGESNVLLRSAIIGGGILQVGLISKGLLAESIV